MKESEGKRKEAGTAERFPPIFINELKREIPRYSACRGLL